MSAKALHLNLLNDLEMKAVSPVRLKVIMPVAAGIICSFVLAWGTFIGVQYAILNSKINGVRGEIDAHSLQATENAAMMLKYRDLLAESAQFSYYMNGRARYGKLLKELAYAIPAGITLKSLSIPTPPDQDLYYPVALRMAPLQGPTSSVERVEIRFIGIARDESSVFEMMENFKTDSITNMLSIVDRARDGVRESPRVNAFRQDSSVGGNVFFDLVYDLKPREFVK